MRLFYFIWVVAGVLLWVELGRISGTAEAETADLTITNLSQLREADGLGGSYSIRLEGDVWWTSREGKLVLRDGTGAEEVEADWVDRSGNSIQAGDRVRLTGTGTVMKTGQGYQLGGRGPVVDNNGVHEMIEKSGQVFLTAGWQPLRVDWFNGVEKFGLEVEYEGPGLSQQKIPDGVLFRMERGHWVNGLDYCSYEAAAEVLPDFENLTAIKSGTVANFDLKVRSRDERSGLRFTGFLKVARDGLYTFYTKSDDGSQLYVGSPSWRWEKIGRANFPTPFRLAPGQILSSKEDCFWAEAEGTVTFACEQTNGLVLELSSGTGRMRVEVADGSGWSPTVLWNSRIQVTGVGLGGFTVDGQKIASWLLIPNTKGIRLLETRHNELADTNTLPGALPTLTTCTEVHRLKREEAQRGYPVRVAGVVTCVLPEHQAFTIQDGTRGIYGVDLSRNGRLPNIGDFLELTGVTDPSLFAPIVNARQLRVLGAGHLPDAVRPTWDQLMNGSLDAQYVELQGMVIAVNDNGLTLLTRDGRIKMELRVKGAAPETLARYEDALVRVRGCLFANWDYVTHEVKAGEIRIYGADISVDEPAPADLFALPGKSAAELLMFDPQASEFERVKVAGQILGEREGEFFMMDGASGLRFVLKKPVELAAGDRVEVVGFPELSGASPILREAVVRKKGRAPLPPAGILKDDLLVTDRDATQVRVTGLLVSRRETATEMILEMQHGVRTFLARLAATNALAQSLPVGSKLELTGIYDAQGGNKAIGQNISSFELLLPAADDIKVLARPPWWTLARLLFVLGALACVLAVTVLWITQLHRKVEERSAALAEQIHERQRVEQQRTMEQERARIAQDLHDELGSGLTEVSMLGARARAAFASEDKRRDYLEQMRTRAQEMVMALDEIVWAMNPRHDSLASLISYFSLYADRFLGVANIVWRLEHSAGTVDFAVDSRRRHQLFLAFKEALTNVVRHAGATEVWLSIGLEKGDVRLMVADNGRGFADGKRTEDMDGMANMRARLEKVGGRFEILTQADRPGATVCFFVPAK
jgi:signal transduction histidine kinase